MAGMTYTRAPRRRRAHPVNLRMVAAAIGLAAVAACTANPVDQAAAPLSSTSAAVPTSVQTTQGPAVTVPSLTPSTAVPSSSVPTASDSSEAPGSTGVGETTTPATTTASATTTTPDPTTTTPDPTTSAPPPPPATPKVSWRWTVKSDAEDVSPTEPVVLRVKNGTLLKVTMTNEEGEKIDGWYNKKKSAWAVTPVLGYGRTYTVVATAADAKGAKTKRTLTFNTLTPPNMTYPTAFPLDGNTVGVGQPVAVYFDEPISDKAAAEKAITIKSTPKVLGSFYWVNDQEVRWRPKIYWKPGTKVDVSVKIYGRDLGGGIYGQQDKDFSFKIGKSKIAYVDDNTKMMIVKINGETVKEIPVSMGSDQYPTYNGKHIVAEKYEKKIMDSSTWGLTGTGAYRTEVGWASRISSTGEFVHSAPWSVWAQGSENVSHGCINVSEENAIWFYNNFGPGDVVDIKNTKGDPLKVWDGFGDWQLSWKDYQKGSAL